MKKGAPEKPSYYWEKEFRSRINAFEANRSQKGEGLALSIKIYGSGCFHREHSPYAYRIIDGYLNSHHLKYDEVEFIEHESGPELLVYLALGTAAISLSKSILDLIITIIKSRQEGIKRGDRHQDSFELVVRGFDKKGNIKEDRILKIFKFDSSSNVDVEVIEKLLQHSIHNFLIDKPQKSKSSQKGSLKKRRK